MLRNVVLVAIAGAALASCGGMLIDPYVPVTNAVPPRESNPSGSIAHALACIKDLGALRGTRIAVAIHADGTGKYNHVADGATGNFLPQGTTAVYASQAVLFAGATPFNYYELNTERAMRAFANLDTQKRLAGQQDAVLPHYVISTSFTALDFIGGPDIDVQIGGIGPKYLGRGAAIEATAELYQPGSRRIDRVSSVQRYVAFREAGATVNKFFGSGGGTLVTGGVLYSDQQRLQEASRDVVALTVADVLARFPRVPGSCREEVAALLDGEAPQAPPPARTAGVVLNSRD